MNSVNIVSHDSLMAQRRRETRDVRLPFEFNGKECFVETKMVNGEMEQIELDKPIGEMLTTAEIGRATLWRRLLSICNWVERLFLWFTSRYIER